MLHVQSELFTPPVSKSMIFVMIINSVRGLYRDMTVLARYQLHALIFRTANKINMCLYMRCA